MTVYECAMFLFLIVTNIIAWTLLATKMSDDIDDIEAVLDHYLPILNELGRRVDELDGIVQVLERAIEKK